MSWKWKITHADLEKAGLSAGARADSAIQAAIEADLGEWSSEDEDAETSSEEGAVSRSQIKRLIEEGAVRVDGEPIKPNFKLKEGAEIIIEFPEPVPLDLVPEDRPLEILYEDEHLVVVNKPPNLTVHPSSTQLTGTLVHVLLHHIKDLSGIGGKLRPGIVHRIDKDTSGALVITKTDEAHRALAETFSKHAIERVYWALCYGAPAERSQTKIESLIGRNPNDRKKMAMDVKGGRSAITFYKKIEEYGTGDRKPFASWLEMSLKTGRTHQIRVHLTGIGHSLLGDPVYGVPSEKQPKWQALPADVREAVKHLPGQALHARVLGFEHPISKKQLRFEAEPPPEFKALLSALRRYRGEQT